MVNISLTKQEAALVREAVIAYAARNTNSLLIFNQSIAIRKKIQKVLSDTTEGMRLIRPKPRKRSKKRRP